MFTMLPLLLATGLKAEAFSMRPLSSQPMRVAEGSVFNASFDQIPRIHLRSDEVAVAETISLPIVLSSAPRGLSGYLIEVKLSNPAVADIVSTEFPSFGLTNKSQLDGRVRLAAADLSRMIERGDTDATLVTLDIKGLAQGTSQVELQILQMDDDDGNVLEPWVISGAITVN